MKILIINTGSSSLKFAIYQYENSKKIISGIVEKIKSQKSIIKIVNTDGSTTERFEKGIENHQKAIEKMFKILTNSDLKILKTLSEIKIIGHRVVHGGSSLKNSVILNNSILNKLKQISELAPLHNPNAITAIEAVLKILPHAKQVLCFDTSWHQTIKEHAFLYAIPYSWYKNHNIRKYGFHGLSYSYITKRSSEILNKKIDSLNLIILHLGNGASINAVKNGKSYDTSMGITPLEGLVMGTRSGDIDPSIINLMSTILNKTTKQIEEILNKESGILGISEKSNDMRDIWNKIEEGEYQSKLAVEIMTYRIKKYIGSYIAALDFNVDAIVFTGGIGVTDYGIRALALKGFEKIGIELDLEKNEMAQSKYLESEISTINSKLKILAIPTNEESTILEDIYNLIPKNL
ncbi:acetate kinase [Borreliella burgdorferi 29805]|uniref:acetate kinase n=2 Tax=Borreliella burgdorferi TaxID=139 RepID=UPI00017F3D53|nr:acetate kinase [Borreliella burgdorferi]EEH32955.1 acetate kinase [Borreliella burgdorferi 29805]MCD2372533.1 acetate kinase [Borreliella burgdorferi]MCD2376027.1 acetate kinase [Borreliella burgdorferi]MCD2377068.1 acetate kinase [Borreliella burgdorferi]MCD2387779.1 acetate kinase [Borreliella burgdorferi]